MSNSSVSFASPIRVIKDNYSKFVLTTFLGPIFFRYSNFEEKLEEAFNNFNSDEGLNEESLPLFLEAISFFDIYQIKEIVNQFPILLSKSFFETDDYLFNDHPNILAALEKYSLNEIQIQGFRNSLMSYTRIFFNDLAELEKSYKVMESLLNQANDATANTRSGLTGGAIGATIGSFLFPGLGTIAGGFLGGYFMGKTRTDGIIDQVANAIDTYIEHTRSLIQLMVENSKELYLLSGRMYEEIQVKRMRNVYFETKKANKEIDFIFTEYYKQQLKESEDLFLQKCDDEDNDSPTWGDLSNFVYNFIKG